MFDVNRFNRNHFTRIYPDFSRRSWNSYNFEPIQYWLAGCQMVALNFQTPGLEIFILFSIFISLIQIVQCTSMLVDLQLMAGEILFHFYPSSFSFSSFSCGYVLMPNYIRSFDSNKFKSRTSVSITIRVLAVRHLRTVQAKSILRVHVKTTLVNKQKPTENPSYTSKFELEKIFSRNFFLLVLSNI